MKDHIKLILNGIEPQICKPSTALVTASLVSLSLAYLSPSLLPHLSQGNMVNNECLGNPSREKKQKKFGLLPNQGRGEQFSAFSLEITGKCTKPQNKLFTFFSRKGFPYAQYIQTKLYHNFMAGIP